MSVSVPLHQRSVLFDPNRLQVVGRFTEADDSIPRFVTHPGHDDLAGIVRLMRQPDPRDVLRVRKRGQKY